MTSSYVTPKQRHEQRLEEQSVEHYQDFCAFAKHWLLIGDGSCQRNMVVFYFRDYFPSKYRYSEQISDDQIEAALDKWNYEFGKATVNELGMYLGICLNTRQQQELNQERELHKRKQQIQMYLAECKKKKEMPPLELFKEAVQLGIVKLPPELEAQKEGPKPNAKQVFRESLKVVKRESKKGSSKDKSSKDSKGKKKDKDKDDEAEKRESFFEWSRYGGEFEWNKYGGDFEWSNYQEEKDDNNNKETKSKLSTKDHKKEHKKDHKTRTGRSKSPTRSGDTSRGKSKSKSPTRSRNPTKSKSSRNKSPASKSHKSK